MTQKDWVLLIVPILCNGVVVFILQKVFEKRQLAIAAKQKYILVLQEKIDVALELFMNIVKTSGDDLLQNNYVNQFANSFLDIYYYYQQNQTLFGAISKEMDKAINTYEKMQKDHQRLNKDENYLFVMAQIEDKFRTLHKLLQKVQNKCIKYKV